MNSFVSFVAATSYYWLWSGFSTVQIDTGHCLYIPQRWLLYCFTAPHIIEIQSKMSDYSVQMRRYVIFLNMIMLVAGGVATVPWMAWHWKVILYVISAAPFPHINLHMWNMFTAAIHGAKSPESKRSITFIRVFSIFMWVGCSMCASSWIINR